MNILVYKRKSTNITIKQIVTLLHESFQERLNEGLHYTCSSITEEQFIKKTKDGIIFVAVDESTNELIGTSTLNVHNEKQKYGYMEYVAIKNTYKHGGIGSLLLKHLRKEAMALGCEYIISDTSTKASSAVRYHLKNGFKIVGLESYRSTNYWSYVFRMQLRPSFIWNNSLYLKTRYILSFIFIKMTRTIDGSDTWIGKVIKVIRKGCKS